MAASLHLRSPAERFSFIELTDEKGGERLDRTPFAKGDIAIADRGYMHPDPLAHILEQGADVIVRTAWKGARWLDGKGKPFDLLAALAAAGNADVLDRLIWIARKNAKPLALRLVAFRKPPEAAEASRARPGARRSGKAMPSPTARWPLPNGLSSSPRSMQKPSPQPGSVNSIVPAGASRWHSSA